VLPGFFGRAIATGLVITFLAGCAMTQGGQGASPPTVVASGSHEVGPPEIGETKAKSWMYVAADGRSYVLSYPKGKIAGTIAAAAKGACSDSDGDAFLTEQSAVVEYSHGGTTPISSLDLPGQTYGCSIDPISGDLAVVFGGASGNNVAVFANAQGSPTLYKTDVGPMFCGYDNNGDLFVDGTNGDGVGVAELPSGGSQFLDIQMDTTIPANPGAVQWDGTYMTVVGGASQRAPNSAALYRLSITGSSGTVVSKTQFAGKSRNIEQSWLNANLILIPVGTNGDESRATKIGVWQYPSGGKPQQYFKTFGKQSSLKGITISN